MNKSVDLQKIDSSIPMKVIEISVQTLTGKTIQIQKLNTDTISDLKIAIQNIEGIPYDQQKLMFAGKQLEDHVAFSEYNITNGSVLHLAKMLKEDFGLILKNQITKKEENVKLDYTNMTVRELKKQIIQMFDIPKDWLQLYVKDKKLNVSEDTKIGKVGMMPGVKVEFSYPSYKEYVDIQQANGSWNENILDVCDKTKEQVIKSMPDNVEKWGDENQQLEQPPIVS